MLAARQRLLDLRSNRIEQLLRVRVVLRGLLGDFFETLDPIANARLAEVSAEGSKAHGDLAVTLVFFEGSRMRLSVDSSGRFSHELSIPSAFDEVERIVEFTFSSDMSRAEVLYVPKGAPEERRQLDLVAVTLALLANAVAAVEEEASEAPAALEPPIVTAPVAASSLASLPKLSVAGRISAGGPPATTVRTSVGNITAPNKDVLTFNVG